MSARGYALHSVRPQRSFPSFQADHAHIFVHVILTSTDFVGQLSFAGQTITLFGRYGNPGGGRRSPQRLKGGKAGLREGGKPTAESDEDLL